jgi:hypothetical protein
MPVAVIAGLFVVLILALVASPEATRLYPGQSAAPEPIGAMLEMTAGDDSGQTPSAAGCGGIALTDSAIAERCDDIVGTVTPPSETRDEPEKMPSGIALIAIAILVILGTIEVLFRCTIYERPGSANHRQTDKKRVRRSGPNRG